MRESIAALSLLILLSACSSGSGSAAARKTHVTPQSRPEIDIAQTSGVAIAARHVQGGVSVRFAVRVANPGKDSLTLRRVTVQSVGEGAYHLGPYSVPFDVQVASAQHQDVQFWVPAYTGLSVVGANGPVTVRVVCEFDWTKGTFQEVVTRIVNSRASTTGQ